MTTGTVQQLKPVSAGERIRELDIVRGFALFGVLLVNIVMFNTTATSKAVFSGSLELGFLNNLLGILIQVFAVGNFYTIFSFLFGLGFYVFMERAESRGHDSKRLFLRRSRYLILFGALHYLLVWRGDVLHAYGIIALILLRFRNADLRTLKKWIMALLVISTLMLSGFMLLNDAAMARSDEAVLAFKQESSLRRAATSEVYAFGSFGEVVTYRLQNETSMTVSNTILMIPKVLGLFLMGFYVGKRGILSDIKGNLGVIKKAWGITGVLGCAATLLYAVIQYNVVRVNPSLHKASAMLFKETATIFVFLFYTTSIVLLYNRAKFGAALKPLGYMGQMALTNYLVQCLLCSFLLYGYGLGLNPSIAMLVLITIVIYAIQLFFSRAWLSKYKYGPCEGLWRHLTYSGSV